MPWLEAIVWILLCVTCFLFLGKGLPLVLHVFWLSLPELASDF
jgi:hypothetical protein